MKLLHIHIRGWTATFRLPLLYSGTGLTSPLPPYSTLLGLIGSLAGREIHHDETRIGFIFQCAGIEIDIESLERLQIDKKGNLKTHPDRNIVRRQFLIRPQLDLFLDNLELQSAFELPQNPPCLGRSQDLAWIISVCEIEANPVKQGMIRGTLVPFPQEGASGQILVLPDFFDNARDGYTRTIGKLNRYQVVKWDMPAIIKDVKEGELLCVDGRSEAVYLHNLGISKDL